MKLIEKKCPNCGSSLSFGPNDKETKCTYCNASFEIERENESESVIPENFLLHQKTVRRMSTAIMIISIIVFIAIFITFILMFFRMSSFINR